MQTLQKTDAAKKKKGAFQQVGTVGRKALPHLPHCSFTLRMFFLHYLTLVLCFPLVPVVPVLSCGGVHSCDTKADVGPRVQVPHVPEKGRFKRQVTYSTSVKPSSAAPGLQKKTHILQDITRHARLQSLKTHTHSQISLGPIFTL